jgi:hypothetical protein
MHNSSNRDHYPALCLEVGKDCRTCVRDTATEAAKVCPGLKGKELGRLFVMLYPNSGCAPMAKRFAHEYAATPALLKRKPVIAQGAVARAKGAVA